MALSPRNAVKHYASQHLAVNRYCVAYSAGMDSHVLLQIAAEELASLEGVRVRAIHVNHGLNQNSGAWAEHAQQVCRKLEIPLVTREVTVEFASGDGLEAGARAARYAAFADVLEEGEHLLMAQHADDQAETFLLQALRGSGPDGLASIPGKRSFARGIMARPLLACTREALASFADEASLSWIEDPSNEDTRFDRNFLRLEILPQLKKRWPSAAQTLSRSAMRSGAASQTLLVLAQRDLDGVMVADSSQLTVSRLASLSRERAYNVLRLWVRQAGYRMPRLQDLVQVLNDLVNARHDAEGRVNAREYEFRRHRDHLYLLAPHTTAQSFDLEWPAPFDPLHVAAIELTISKESCEAQGLKLPEQGSVFIRSRQGSEIIKLGKPAYHKQVKKLLQESGMPPWERDRVPLLFVGEQLAAVWNVAIAVDFQNRQELCEGA